jgi:hypothetical protein
MINKLFATSLLAFALTYHVNATADATLTIDAAQNCLDTSIGALNQTAYADTVLGAGRYLVSYTSNNMSPAEGSTQLIDTVIMRALSYNTPGPLNWGIAFKKERVIRVAKGDVMTISAFIIDWPCGDNSGSATITFKKV